MEKLPNEIIQHILADSTLSVADVVNFSSTCFKFRETIISNRSLWRIKYFQRWPETDIEIVSKNWYNECIIRISFEKQVQLMLSTMCSEFFQLDVKKIGDPELNFTVYLVNSHKYGYYYLRDFLMSINSLPLTQSLTNKYYGNILLKYIHKMHCREVWNILMQLNIEEQTLEKGAIFVASWCQEYEKGLWKRVTSELDDIAHKVKHHLLQSILNHPIKNTPEEILSMWKKENIVGNAFQPDDCESIISAINYILFKDLKYCVAYDFNEMDKRQFGINYALLDRKANPFMFSVIYESIARRLGVKIEILEFLDDCFLRWKEDYRVANSRSHYILFSPDGIVMTYLYPRQSSSDEPDSPCNMQKIAQRAAYNVHPTDLRGTYFSLRDALELKLVVEPFCLEWYQQLSQTHMLHELDARELISKLKDIRGQISKFELRDFRSILHSLELYQQMWERNHKNKCLEKLVIQNRVEGIDFAVGMIVRDKFWEMAGVIYGWSFRENSLQKSRPKVYYEVLIEGGSYRCTSQENLQILHSPPFVSHPSLGRFFDEYCITYYKPNKELELRYPQDVEALQEILKNDRKT